MKENEKTKRKSGDVGGMVVNAPTFNHEAFERRLFKIRECKGMSLSQFANKLNITSAATVHNYENGKSIPSLDRLVLYSEIGRCSLDYLIKGEEAISRLESILNELDEPQRDYAYNSICEMAELFVEKFKK